MLQAAHVARDPNGWMERRWRRYGDVFSSRFPIFGRVVYVASPAYVKDLFTGDHAVFHAGEANARPLGTVMGDYSLLTLDDEPHMTQRKLLLPPFHGENVRRYAELVAEITERDVDRWPLGRPFALRDRMQAITLEVILRAVFGVRDEERLALYRARITRLAEIANLLVVAPLARLRRYRCVLEGVDRLIYEEIAARRADPRAEERGDVLSLLLAARHDDGSPMSDSELRDELMTLLTAGHETTATGLAWAFERLLRNPAALERLTDEPADGDYLDAVVKETLRVRPVISDIARKLTADIDLAGYRIPAGTLVVAAIAALHVRPDLYPDPHEFRPERFLEDGGPEPYSWIPFGGGVRRCIGASFAQMEMKVALRMIVSRARLRAADPEPERARLRNVTTVPARGAAVILERRLPGRAPYVAASMSPERKTPA